MEGKDYAKEDGREGVCESEVMRGSVRRSVVCNGSVTVQKEI